MYEINKKNTYKIDELFLNLIKYLLTIVSEKNPIQENRKIWKHEAENGRKMIETTDVEYIYIIPHPCGFAQSDVTAWN